MSEIYRRALEAARMGNAVCVATEFWGRAGVTGKRLSRRLSQSSRDAALEKEGERFVFFEPVLPKERLILLGAGHIALHTAGMGAAAGFQVIVADDREEFASQERFPMAERVIAGSFEAAVNELTLTNWDSVVVMTRGHQGDYECVKALLRQPQTRYLGMVASKKRASEMLDRLRGEGADPRRVAAIQSPAGLSIGAATPGEIAVSVMGQIISFRRQKAGGGKPLPKTDGEARTIEAAAQEPGQWAMATVVEAQGSTPRGAGAKMIILRQGESIGSIGGGAVEHEITKEARRLIGKGEYRMLDFDLDQGLEAQAGMACGGKMRVLIEDRSIH